MIVLRKYLAFLNKRNDGNDDRKMDGLELLLVHSMFIGGFVLMAAIVSLCVTVVLMLYSGPSSVPETGSALSVFLRTAWADPTVTLWFRIAGHCTIWGGLIYVGGALCLHYYSSSKEETKTQP